MDDSFYLVATPVLGVLAGVTGVQLLYELRNAVDPTIKTFHGCFG